MIDDNKKFFITEYNQDIVRLNQISSITQDICGWFIITKQGQMVRLAVEDKTELKNLLF